MLAAIFPPLSSDICERNEDQAYLQPDRDFIDLWQILQRTHFLNPGSVSIYETDVPLNGSYISIAPSHCCTSGGN